MVHRGVWGLADAFHLLLPVLLIWIVAAAPARAQESEDLFSVAGIPVDASAESATKARDIAHAQGQREALELVLRRLAPRAEYDALPDPTDAEIAVLVRSISITNERTSSTRYLAKLSVNFKKFRIRRLLQDLSIPYAETRSKPRLVLAVYEAAGTQILWDDPNPWRAAWEARDIDTGGPIPLVLPKGDLADIAAIGAAQVLVSDPARIAAIAARYDLTDILIVHARLEIDLAANRPRVHVELREIGPASQGIIVQSFTGLARDRVPELLAEAVAKSVLRLEEDWKHDNLLQFDSPVRLSARVPLGDLQTWVEVRRRLAESAVVRRVELSELSQSAAQVVLHYLGDPGQLALDLAQQDISLAQTDGFWTLTLNAAPAGGARSR